MCCLAPILINPSRPLAPCTPALSQMAKLYEIEVELALQVGQPA